MRDAHVAACLNDCLSSIRFAMGLEGWELVPPVIRDRIKHAEHRLANVCQQATGWEDLYQMRDAIDDDPEPVSQ